MKKKIVFQLFFLTFSLCCIIIAMIFAGQFFFFHYWYIDKEKENIQMQLEQYYKSYETTQDEKTLQNIEASYFKQYGIMIARLDELANIKELPTGNYYIDVADKSNPAQTSIIVLNNIFNAKRDIDYKFGMIIASIINKINKTLLIDGISKDGGKTIFPLSMSIRGFGESFVTPNYNEIFDRYKYDVANPSVPEFHLDNRIFVERVLKEISFTDYNNSKINNTLYDNENFADRILQFQADWISEKVNLKEDGWSQSEISLNGIKYIESIKPIIKDGKIKELIYTLTSLQPLTKTTDLMKNYYVYIILFILALTVLICIYYSKIITKPLLMITDKTQKIINFEFGDKISVKSKNEIGVLSQNINQLSERLEEYIKELQNTNEKLENDLEKEKKLEIVRKEFIAGVSHELKTPLSVLQVSASMLQDGISPEKNEYYWNAIENEIEKMNTLVNEMLDLAKYGSGTYQIQLEPVNIGKLIKKIHEILQFQVEERSLKVIVNIEPAMVKGKENLLEQVITNLFTNAIRYTDPKQSIIVEVKEEQNTVYVGIENKGNHLSKDDLNKIWDQFYRGDTSRQRVNGGTGLGLSIVRNILELHEAKYGAKNTKDGVLFYFYLDKYNDTL